MKMKSTIIVEEPVENENSSICQRALGSCLSNSRASSDIQEVFEDTGHTPINQIIKILVLGPGLFDFLKFS